jgi:hypothetical protein
MGIEDAIRDATSASRDRSAAFDQQLRTNQQFSTKMQDAGVVPRKRGFTIPLMERIVVRA